MCAEGAVLGVTGTLRQSQSTQPELGSDVSDLRLRVERFSPGVLRVKITDAAQERWEVPHHLLGWGA